MRLSPRLIFFEVLAFLVFAAIAGAGFLAWRLSQGPIDLEFFRPQVERSLTEARGGQPVKIRKLVLEWVKDANRVEAAAHDVTALGGDGQVVFEASRAVVTMDAAALLSGKLKTKRVRLERGTASVVRSEDGVWSTADMVLFREPTQSANLMELLGKLRWSTMVEPLRSLIAAGSFEGVDIVDFQINVEDRKLGTRWGASPVSGRWVATAEGVSMTLDAQLSGKSDPNRIALRLAADGEVSQVTGELLLDGVDPVGIARMAGFTDEAFEASAPANALFSVEASEAQGLKSARLSLSNVKGKGRVAGVDVDVADLDLTTVYDPANRGLKVDTLRIESDKVAGSFSGSLDLATALSADPANRLPFTLSGREVMLNLTPVFEKPWSFTSVSLKGGFEPAASRFHFDGIDAATGGLTANGKGEVWLDRSGEHPRVGVKLEATGEGKVTPEQVLEFWPVDLGTGGRTWVRENMLAGEGTRAVFKVDWPPGANDGGFLPDDRLSLDFDVSNASISFLKDFPPVTQVKGVGHLKGNSLNIDIMSGKLDTWTVDGGRVSLPRFHPKGDNMEVQVTGEGDLRDLMRVLDASDLQIGSKYGLKIDQMQGTGSLEVLVRRPMQDVVPDEALVYEVHGGFRDVTVPDLAAGFGLKDSYVTVNLDPAHLVLSGAGQFGPSAVSFNWRETLGETEGSELTATAKVTPDLINAFGFAARNFMRGEAEVDLRASGSGRDFSSVSANVDFTLAALDIPELGWSKKADTPARGAIRFGRDSGRSVMTGDIRADGLELIGEAEMGEDGSLVSAGIERIFSRDNIDLHGTVLRRTDGGYRVALEGALFDARPWTDQILGLSSEAGDAAGAATANGPVNEIKLKSDLVRLRDDAELMAVDVDMDVGPEGPIEGHVRGLISADRKLNVTVTPEDGVRHISVQADDAGFGARVLLKTDYLSGGRLSLDGVFREHGADVDLVLTDVRLKNAPLVAQLLSLASLRGLTDVLNGDGVMFSRIETPLQLGGDRIGIEGLRASGPAMGMTARGWIAPQKGELSIDGVLVPSFGINSALGGIPVIGDLFVSRQGEGIFAPTYSVRGTFSRARVSVNPIAAMTPGVLRRIFENPEEPVAQAEPDPASPPPQ
ncbi:MAG: DUF3971 domain-containing protein [Hyphomonadaceae bacterium]